MWARTSLVPLMQGTLALVVLACVLVAVAGFGIYGFGAWRVWWVLAGSVATALLVAITLLGGARIQMPLRRLLPLLLVVAAVWMDQGWTPNGVPIEFLHARLSLVLMLSVVFSQLAWLYPRAARALPFGLFVAFGTAWYLWQIVEFVPSPFVDVWHHLDKAAAVLAEGKNPYATFFPDFYQGRAWYGFDAPGFPYPPPVLLTAYFAKVIAVDVRYVLGGLVVLSAGIVRQVARTSGWPRSAATLLAVAYMQVPHLGFVLVSGHSEPISGFLLALSCLLMSRGNVLAAFFVAGVFFTSKQYLIVLVPIALLATSTWRHVFALGAGSLILWLPWIVLDVRALWNATFQTHLDRPARKDALTISAWRLNHGLMPLRRWLPIATGLVGAILSGLRFKTPQRIPLYVGMVLLPMLLVSPQAFGNYYTLAYWSFIVGLASFPAHDARPEVSWAWKSIASSFALVRRRNRDLRSKSLLVPSGEM